MNTTPENVKPPTFLNKMEAKATILTFFIIALFCSLITIFSFHKSHSYFIESQDKIIASNTYHMEMLDSILLKMHGDASSNFAINQNRIKTLVKDSILARIPRLNRYQQNELHKYAKSIIALSVSELGYNDWIENIDAIIKEKHVYQIQQETKHLLELEFNKIQHEYEALALWGGILTIVFLIFSFYSLFKTEDIIKQGKDGLNRMYDLEQKGDAKYKEIKMKSDAAITTMNNEIQTSQSNAQTQLDDVNSKTQKFIDSIPQYIRQTLKDSFDKQLADDKDELKSLRTKIDRLEEDLMSLNSLKASK